MIKKVLAILSIIITVFISFLAISNSNEYMIKNAKTENVFDEIFFTAYAHTHLKEQKYFNKIEGLRFENIKTNILKKGNIEQDSNNAEYMQKQGILNKFVYSLYNVPSNIVKISYDQKVLEKYDLEGFDIYINAIGRNYNEDILDDKPLQKNFVTFVITKKINTDYKLVFLLKYDVDKKTINKEWNVECNDECVYGKTKYQKASELSDKINTNQFDKFTKEVIDQLLIYKWFNIYKSDFSNANYGKLKINNKWEKNPLVSSDIEYLQNSLNK